MQKAPDTYEEAWRFYFLGENFMSKKRAITGPYSRVTSPNVFPVVPLRTQMATAASATPVYEEVELNLQFENNEVFDIMKVETWMYLGDINANPANSTIVARAGILDNPASTVNINTAGIFEASPELCYYTEANWQYWEELVYSSQIVREAYHLEEYLEPFTVARNVLWTLVHTLSAAVLFATVVNFRGIIWGRRRRASDSEFKDIIYRERF